MKNEFELFWWDDVEKDFVRVPLLNTSFDDLNDAIERLKGMRKYYPDYKIIIEQKGNPTPVTATYRGEIIE